MKKLYVLIDDDELVRMTWKFKAGASNVDFKAFEGIDDFMEAAKDLPRDCSLYIDSNLGNGVKGEVVAVQIAQMGFSEIHLATGSEASDLSYDKNIIKSVRGKEPPF
jgi:FixJ family two-component response regulator